MAERGGTARAAEDKFYDAGDAGELAAALTAIGEQMSSCVLEFNEPISEDTYVVDLVRVWTDDEELVYGPEQVGERAGESGWRFLGAACTLYQARGEVGFGIGCVGP